MIPTQFEPPASTPKPCFQAHLRALGQQRSEDGLMRLLDDLSRPKLPLEREIIKARVMRMFREAGR